MTDRAASEHVGDRAPELALGLLTGPERAEALVHLARCPRCRAEIDGLAEVADGLLLLAPTSEPPAGFESAVLESIAAERASAPAALRGRLSRQVLLGGAAALVAAGLAVGALVARVAEPGDEWAQAAMVTPSGRDVGDVWVHDDEPGWILVSVPGWKRWDERVGRSLHYSLHVELDSGNTVDVPGVDLTNNGAWGAPSDLDADDVRAVSIVDETGHVWCTGKLA